MTDRMMSILSVLDDTPRGMSANMIGGSLGFDHGMLSESGYSRKGKRMGPANRVNFALSRLRTLGLIGIESRPDGLSGTWYYITDKGRGYLNATETRAES